MTAAEYAAAIDAARAAGRVRYVSTDGGTWDAPELLMIDDATDNVMAVDDHGRPELLTLVDADRDSTQWVTDLLRRTWPTARATFVDARHWYQGHALCFWRVEIT